jgi:xanthine dehydrogenase YagT iron-sulfur-binding subunit
MSELPLAREGSIAPDVALPGALTLSGLRGRPVVLAFVESWSLEREAPADVDALRAHLRGLGTSLVVVSPGGAWCVRPDDDVEAVAGPGEVDAARVARRFGASFDAGTAPAVLVLDEDGVVRFARAHPALDGGVARGLAAALDAAAQARPPRREGALAMTRREWLVTSLGAGLAVALFDPSPARAAGAAASAALGPGEVDVRLRVNGSVHRLRVDPRVSLLDALRERMGLTGTKKGCDHGQCGACTVLVDGRRVNACLLFAVAVQGAEITTIEGLAKGDALHPVQAAFVEHDAFQCGYCTPGQIMSAVGLLSEGRARSDDEVREQMSGNLCRCGAYANIVAAVQAARKGGGA